MAIMGVVKAHCRAVRVQGFGQRADSRKRATKRARPLNPAVSDMAVL